MLGIGEYQVLLTARGGSPVIGEIPYSSISYDRSVLDAVGGSSLFVPPTEDDDLCFLLSRINSWEHEISIYRDPDLAFVGPVTGVSWGDNGTGIQCRNLFEWTERRLIYSDFDPITDDLVNIFVAYLEDALAPDTSPNITITVQNLSGITGERRVLASEHRRVADELRELARSGVDFTMRGRELLIAGQELDLPSLGILHDDACSRRTLTQEGLVAATRVTVLGQSGGAGSISTFGGNTLQVIGVAEEIDSPFGLIDRTYSESQIRDQISADYAAGFRLDWLDPPPESLSVDLSPSASFFFDDLIAGKKVDVRVKAGCRDIIGDLRVSSVRGQVNVGPDGETEIISLDIDPIGGE